MVKEGYLIRYDLEKKYAEPVYGVLDNGKFRYFRKPGGVWLGEIELTGAKTKVRPLADSELVKNALQIDSAKIVRDSNDEPVRLEDKKTVVLGAYTKKLRNEWGLAFLTWQRYYFKSSDDMRRKPDLDECEEQFNLVVQAIENSGMKTPRKAELLRTNSGLYKPKAFTFSLPPAPVAYTNMNPQGNLFSLSVSRVQPAA